MAELEKISQVSILYDFYGQLLTIKQREIFELYFFQDLSLGEIAEEMGVSRQAVYDIVRRSQAILDKYEKKLDLVARFNRVRVRLDEAIGLLDADRSFNPRELRQLLQEIRDLELN